MQAIQTYVSQLILGYLNDYIRLREDQLKISFWEGDAVLNRLELRYDILEHLIPLPIKFESGIVNELVIHIPWTKLGYEPICITFKNLECIFKLKSKDDSREPEAKPEREPLEELEKPETSKGNLYSAIHRWLSRTKIVIDNLILKFVQKDLVLSLNCLKTDCFSLSDEGQSTFMRGINYMLNRAVNFQDITICLDKTNENGKLDFYQQPLIYKAQVETLIKLIYTSTCSEKNEYELCWTIIDFHCNKVNLVLNDVQLDLIRRLVEIFSALGEETLNWEEVLDSPKLSDNSNCILKKGSKSENVEESGSWGSWAWSFVPSLPMPNLFNAAMEFNDLFKDDNDSDQEQEVFNDPKSPLLNLNGSSSHVDIFQLIFDDVHEPLGENLRNKLAASSALTPDEKSQTELFFRRRRKIQNYKKKVGQVGLCFLLGLKIDQMDIFFKVLLVILPNRSID
ncbi:hypothetical protein Ciccas_006356 [Cichlidogyrus casuarinus]|uniref:Chorein N-terminal domain-containing protein n=1 Tax=Cichlidogyrus casuarinus TaxID=1844966 RepID=A0ABD2Q6J0_9PLAT